MISQTRSLNQFLSKITIADSGCWIWIGYKDSDGYAKFGRYYSHIAHRFIYDYYYGNIDPRLTIDHTCRNRACVNPAHLEQVTVQENTLRSPIALAAINSRKTHCPRGHPLSGENLLIGKSKRRPNERRRRCRICERKINNLYHQKRKLKESTHNV